MGFLLFHHLSYFLCAASFEGMSLCDLTVRLMTEVHGQSGHHAGGSGFFEVLTSSRLFDTRDFNPFVASILPATLAATFCKYVAEK